MSATALPMSWPYFHTVSPRLMSVRATLWPIGTSILLSRWKDELSAVTTPSMSVPAARPSTTTTPTVSFLSCTRRCGTLMLPPVGHRGFCGLIGTSGGEVNAGATEGVMAGAVAALPARGLRAGARRCRLSGADGVGRRRSFDRGPSHVDHGAIGSRGLPRDASDPMRGHDALVDAGQELSSRTKRCLVPCRYQRRDLPLDGLLVADRFDRCGR